ncbi:MAG: type II secretion system protein GspD [Rheinheimera sp.]
MSNSKKVMLPMLMASVLSSCVTAPESKHQIPASVLAENAGVQAPENDISALQPDMSYAAGYQELTPLSAQRRKLNSSLDLSADFPNSGELTIAADNMPGNEFLHTVFGEQLQVNYVIADGIANIEAPFSLNLQQAVSKRQLFVMTTELLASRQIDVSLRDGVYFIHPRDPNRQKNSVLGYGRNASDVPNVPGVITQLVPVLFNQDISVERNIMDLTNVQVMQASGQSAYYFKGERTDILRAIEILELLDNPSARGRHVGLLRLTYITTKDFVEKIPELLASEGLAVDINKAANRNLALITLDQIGALAMFATDKVYIDRVSYWAKQLDQPTQTLDKQYFMFYPRYARARDLGESVAALIGSSQNLANQARDTQSAIPAESQNQSNVRTGEAQSAAASSSTRSAVSTVQNENMMMTVDERANALIFFTTGKDYQGILPMIQRLDTMPKQIILEATIAEVTLTDEFAMGVEFALKNGRFSLGTVGALGLDKIGGVGFSYSDKAGLDRILGQLTQKDGRVNILSSPSIVVRDGVTANISVGTDLPIVTATTSNPLDPDEVRQINSQGYRKTGVELSVTPTISAQGLVVLEIDQSISNNADTDVTSSGNPAILERTLKTEVIAQSGQTILLGGLMSENKNRSNTKIPFLGDLPVIGKFFSAERDSTTKTELILMITPRVIDNTSQWQGIRQKLSEGLELIQLPEEKTSN